jgi:hypothetical protein
MKAGDPGMPGVVGLDAADLASAVAEPVVISSPLLSPIRSLVSPSSMATVLPARLRPTWMRWRATWMPLEKAAVNQPFLAAQPCKRGHPG